ncbi:MAG: radical SAM protein [Magnetococcales bacterium]|nr:radical SAM protein [Magnetococcales bacterium]
MQIPLFLQKLNNRLILVTPGLIKNKPLFLLRYALRVLFAPSDLRRPIRSVLFHTHYKCNLSCKHCYEKNFNNSGDPMLTLEEKKQVIAECLRLGALSFDFVSGESRLSHEFEELVKACRPERTYITLASNGWGITEAQVRRYMELGIDKINVSLDSWNPKEHDEQRGQTGVHASVMNTMAICEKLGMAYHFTMFIHRDFTRTDNFQKLVEYAIEHRIRVAFKAAVPLGALQGQEDALISEYDVQRMLELHKQYPFLKRDNYGNRCGGCPAIDEVIAITAYGDVLPCNTIHISLGNVRKEALEDILVKARHIHYFKKNFNGCPPAEDRTFISRYLSKTYNAESYPIRAEEVFEELRDYPTGTARPTISPPMQ